MITFTLSPEDSAKLADMLLNALWQVKDLVSQPAHEGQYERIGDILRAARSAVETAIALPPARSSERETGISRHGILLAVEGEIALLARLKVALGLNMARGDALPMDPARVFVSAAVAIRSLLATPTLDPRTEVGDVEHHAAEPFPGA